MINKNLQKKIENNQTINWGIIGCGDVTEIKSGPAYYKTKGFELLAVMRRDLQKAQDYARRHNVKKYYNNAEDLINDEEIDAIYIATPPDSHKFYALMVAKSGKPCCIEKPMTSSFEDSEEIYNTFKNKELPLFVAYYRRSLPRFLKIKSWLEKNYIGKIRHISWLLTQPPSILDLSKKYNWRTDIKIAPGGYFDDLASHGLDLFAYFLGHIRDSSGFSTNQQKLYSGMDSITGSWIHENGITGSGYWNFGSSEHKDEVKVYGSKGIIKFSIFKDENIILDSQNKQEELYIKHPENIQLFHVENMRKHLIDSNFEHPSTGKTAIYANWVMDKILCKKY